MKHLALVFNLNAAALLARISAFRIAPAQVIGGYVNLVAFRRN
jgi:hypothetical protein